MSVDSFHTSGHSPGPDFDKPTALFATASRCRVGPLGFGTVGSTVARRLPSHAVGGLKFTRIFDRCAHRKRDRLSSGRPGRIVWTDRVDDVLTSDVVVARDRAAIVPAPVLSAPRAIVGLEAAKNRMITTSNARFADRSGNISLRGLCVDRRLEAEAV